MNYILTKFHVISTYCFVKYYDSVALCGLALISPLVSRASCYYRLAFCTHRKPDKLWVDKGKRFYNKHVQALVELYSTDNEETSRVIERWNRAMKLKKRCGNMFSANSTEKYIDLLDDISRLHYRP